MKSTFRVLASLLVAAFALVAPASAQAPDKLSIVVFGAPSLGAFMPPIIKANKFDAANRLDIDFAERTPDAYTAQFNSGEFKLGGSAALLTVGLADIRGVKVKYLFNLFDYSANIYLHVIHLALAVVSLAVGYMARGAATRIPGASR